MVESFEQVAQPATEEQTEKPPVAKLLWPFEVTAALLYITLTAFLPYIMLSAEAVVTGAFPFYFSGTFFVLTVLYLGGWVAWLKLNKDIKGKFAPKYLLPLIAIPLSVALFYFVGLFR